MIQSLRPQDRTKAAGLVGLVVAVFALAGFRAKADNSTPQTGSSSVYLNPQGVTGSAPTTNSDKKSDPVIDYTPPTPNVIINPFKDTIAAPSPSNPTMQAPQLYEPMKGQINGAESLVRDGGIPLSSASLPKVPTDFDSISVEGVVTGGEGVAILMIGSSQMVIRQGASFGKGFKLVSVSETHVVIEKGRKQQTLSVKGS